MNEQIQQNVFRQPNSKGAFSILNANIGNLDLGCRDYIYKPCYVAVEKQIAQNIEILSPDIVVLQEVLAPWQCSKIMEENPRKICFYPQSEPQIRRLLGPDYSIVCSNRNQYECVGIKKSIGEFIGCELGELCNDGRTSTEVQNCDNGFNVMAATVRLKSGEEFDLVNVHLESTSRPCRVELMRQLFGVNGESTNLLVREKVLIVGDFNFDPWRDKGEDVDFWRNAIARGWKGNQFIYHSGIVEKTPPHVTSSFIFKRATLDFIVSNFLQGTCNVLGESPGTTRLDGGSGTDHRGLFGYLSPLEK